MGGVGLLTVAEDTEGDPTGHRLCRHAEEKSVSRMLSGRSHSKTEMFRAGLLRAVERNRTEHNQYMVTKLLARPWAAGRRGGADQGGARTRPPV